MTPERRVRVMVNGLGHVGQALLSAWDRTHPSAHLVCAADASRAWLDEAGLDAAAILEAKREGRGPARTAADAALIEQVRPDVLVELTVTDLETGRPALPDIEAALGLGLHVVTSTKSHHRSTADLLHIENLAQTSAFVDHAAVLGGLPITEMADGCGMEVTEIEGILNGTTNYILGRMEEGVDYASALRAAQDEGIAEANPAYDIEGHDSALKLVGLARRFFGIHLDREAISIGGLMAGRRGIDGVELRLVQEHLDRGLRLKLMGRLRRLPDGNVAAEVAPRAVDPSARWFRIGGTTNAVIVHGRMNGTAMHLFLTGPGAGADQTASRVLGNLNHLLEALSWGMPPGDD